MPPRDIAPGDLSATPHGPLVGDELRRATDLLTPKQLRAYQLRRDGHAWKWIAQRMGVSHPRVIHLVAKAEEHLGYTRTVAPKQKTRYKPAAERQAEAERRNAEAWREALDQLEPLDRLHMNRIIRDRTLDDMEVEKRLLNRVRHLNKTYVPAVVAVPEQAPLCSCARPFPNADIYGFVTCAGCGRRIPEVSDRGREDLGEIGDDETQPDIESAQHRGEDPFGDRVEDELGVRPGGLIVEDEKKGYDRL